MGAKVDAFYNQDGYFIPSDRLYCNCHPETCCHEKFTYTVQFEGKVIATKLETYSDALTIIHEHKRWSQLSEIK